MEIFKASKIEGVFDRTLGHLWGWEVKVSKGESHFLMHLYIKGKLMDRGRMKLHDPVVKAEDVALSFICAHGSPYADWIDPE